MVAVSFRWDHEFVFAVILILSSNTSRGKNMDPCFFAVVVIIPVYLCFGAQAIPYAVIPNLI